MRCKQQENLIVYFLYDPAPSAMRCVLFAVNLFRFSSRASNTIIILFFHVGGLCVRFSIADNMTDHFQG